MNKCKLPSILVLLFAFVGFAQAQELDDFVESTTGDTLVVLSFADTGEANTLVNAVELDTDAPDSRVYMLKRGQLYLNSRELTGPEDRPLRIVGEGSQVMVQSNEERPAIVAGFQDGDDQSTFASIRFTNTLELKNFHASIGNNVGDQAYTFVNAGASNQSIYLDNMIMEHTNWVFIASNDYNNNSVYINDSYFVNMSGYDCRRNGGIYDNVNNPTNEIVVENSTHVMAAGMMYKFRNYAINRAHFNHNTFVNISGQLFTTFGYQSNWIVANNLFVNANIQGYYPGLDRGETDQDNLPHGIINVRDELPANMSDTAPEDRMIMVANNGVFWDDRVNIIAEVLNEGHEDYPEIDAPVNNRNDLDWTNQSILWNDRTEGVFENDGDFPLIKAYNWVMEGDPDFVEPLDLMTDQVDELIEYSIKIAGSAGWAISYPLPKWRTEGNPAEGSNMVVPDWPIPVNLAYNNSAYLSAGLGDLPLGDLNWFPGAKAAWTANKAELDAELEAAKEEGREPEFRTLTSITDNSRVDRPTSIKLSQNYPNPFNPTTNIEFTLQSNADVTLEIYDVTGRLVNTLVNNHLSAGSHTATWNATNNAGHAVSSGVYIYRLTVGDVVQAKTMTLIK